MANKRSSRGIAAALAGFIAGYLTALAQSQRGRNEQDRRNNRIIDKLHGLVERYAPLGDDHDEAAG